MELVSAGTRVEGKGNGSGGKAKEKGESRKQLDWISQEAHMYPLGPATYLELGLKSSWALGKDV